jgi:hypothetical protein
MNDNASVHTGPESADSGDAADHSPGNGRHAHHSQANKQAPKREAYDYETADEARKTSEASGKP